MYDVARLLQMAGLTILPLAIIAQLSNSIYARPDAAVLDGGASACFLVGYLMQRYSGGGSR